MSWHESLARVDKTVRALLGETVIYTPASGSPVTVQGVFERCYVAARPSNGENAISSAGPAVFLRLEELPTDPDEDDFRITEGAQVYRAREVKKDGQGGVLILLYEGG